MKTIKYGHGSYRADKIAGQKRTEFISGNKTHFTDLPEDKRKAKLGELWDMATEAMKPEPAPEKEADKPAEKKGKAAPAAPPAEPKG